MSALVYVLDCDHAVKVGITIQTIEERVDDLARGSGLTGIRVVRTWPFACRRDAHLTEKAALAELREHRVVGEWLHCHPLEAVEVIERIIRQGIPLGYYERLAAA